MVQYYYSDKVLEDFYEALAKGDNQALLRVHIPRSEVFYARAAIEANTGVKYSLERIEKAMVAEGMLDEFGEPIKNEE